MPSRLIRLQTAIARALVRLAMATAPVDTADQQIEATRLIWRPKQ